MELSIRKPVLVKALPKSQFLVRQDRIASGGGCGIGKDGLRGTGFDVGGTMGSRRPGTGVGLGADEALWPGELSGG